MIKNPAEHGAIPTEIGKNLAEKIDTASDWGSKAFETMSKALAQHTPHGIGMHHFATDLHMVSDLAGDAGGYVAKFAKVLPDAAYNASLINKFGLKDYVGLIMKPLF